MRGQKKGVGGQNIYPPPPNTMVRRNYPSTLPEGKLVWRIVGMSCCGGLAPAKRLGYCGR